jgi:hypothetical protein
VSAIIINVTSDSSSNSCVLTVKLSPNPSLSGVVYCAKFFRNVTIGSLASIENSGVSVPYAANVDVVTLTIDNVAPFTHYCAYCVAVNSASGSASLTAVNASRISLFIGCCKSIQYTSYPTSVYGYATYYSDSSISSVYFSVGLSSLPTVSVVVRPYLTFLNGSSISENTLWMNPTQQTLLSSSSIVASPDTGLYSLDFYLNGSSYFDESVIVTMELLGTSASEYVWADDSNVTVDVLTVHDVVDPPDLMSAMFSSSGSYLSVKFSSDTDFGGQSSVNTWNCSLLFLFDGSNDATCTWASATEVTVVFAQSSAAAMATVDSVVTLRNGLVGATCSNKYSCIFSGKSTGSIMITAPAVLSSPTVLLTIPGEASSCDDLVVDASSSYGDGGRSWNLISWTVTATSSNAFSEAAAGSTVVIQGILDSAGSISSPIQIDSANLTIAKYCFQLSLTNFIGASASTTSCVTIDDNVNKPLISIPVGMNISNPVYDELSILASVSASSCASVSSLKLHYHWSIFQDGTSESGLSSSSSDPARYLLPAYSLSAGHTYNVTLRVTAVNTYTNASSSSSVSISVRVEHGSIVANIAGGSSRQLPINKALTLDASGSYDQDSLSAVLAYTWSCSVVDSSLTSISSCSSLLSSSSTSTVTIAAYSMTLSEKYAFSVRVAGNDGSLRAASATVYITAADAYTASISVTGPSSGYISVSSKLSLSSHVTGSNFSNLVCKWSAASNSAATDITGALTPISFDFSNLNTLSDSVFPLLVAGYSFVSGRSYLFTLTCCGYPSSTSCTSASTSVSVVGVPYGGYTQVSPTIGAALSQIFTLSSVGWVSSTSECYPFVYAFYSRLSSAGTLQTIRPSSAITYVNTILPAGLSGRRNKVWIASFVTDALGGVANSTTTVKVTVDPTVNTQNVLSNAVSSFLATGYVPDLIQAMNALSAYMNIKNCSVAPNCTAINRDECADTPNTCGSCLSGYTGLVGDSNVPCVVDSDDMAGVIGDPCTHDSNCTLGYCSATTNLCAAPPNMCPTGNPSLICSGHGDCVFEDVSGNVVENCTVVDMGCTAVCVCTDGYGGADCSLNSTQLQSNQEMRASMCSYQQASFGYQDASAAVIDSIAGTLSTTFVSQEIVSDDSKASCLTVLQSLGSLSEQGYIADAQSGTTESLLGIVSNMAMSNWSYYSAGSEFNTRSPLPAILGSVVSGIQASLVAGQSAVTVATDNVRISVAYSAYIDTVGASLSPPQTTAEITYGISTLPHVVVPSLYALEVCGVTAGYAQTTVAQWGKNPHPNSQQLGSSLLQFGLSSSSSATAAATVSISAEVAYFITIQYASRQALNISAANNKYVNRTLPDCTYHNGNKYISCHHCNISTFTDFNVTYACYDASVLCATSTRRARRDRRLNTDDGSTLESSDGGFATYGMVIEAVGREIVTVLSVNPFAVDLQQAKGVLVFVSILVFALIFGSIGFAKWDAADHNNFEYIRSERIRRKRERDENKRLDGMQHKGKRSSKTSHSVYDTITQAFDMKPSNITDYFFGSLAADSGSDGKELSASFDTHDTNDNYDDVDAEFGVQGKDQSEGQETKRQVTDRIAGNKLYNVNVVKDVHSIAGSEEFTFNGDRSDKSVINDFYDSVIPAKTFLSRGNVWKRYMDRLMQFHPYVCMFSQPSCTVTRTMRWLSVMRGILINLFADTLFFGVFYVPETKTVCPTLYTEAECLIPKSEVINNMNLCIWKQDDTCSVNPPPGDLVFTMTLALLTVLCVMPLDLGMGFIMDEYASKRPDISSWGFNANSWLGAAELPDFTTKHGQNQGTDGRDKSGNTNGKHGSTSNERSRLHEHSAGNTVQGFRRILRDSPLSAYIASIVRHNNDELQHSSDKESGLKDRVSAMDDILNDINPFLVYFDYCTPEEELKYILDKVHRFWVVEMNNPNPMLNSRSKKKHMRLLENNGAVATEEEVNGLNEARAAAFVDILHIYPNGTAIPLPFYQWIWYGTAHNKIKYLITNARRKADGIVQQLRTMEMLGMYSSIDIFLIQHFVMEQVGSLTKYAISKQLFTFANELSPFTISVSLWLLAWTFTIGSFGLFIYWIFAWGATTGVYTLRSWGVNFGIGVSQDFLFVQPVKILVLHVLCVEAARPQLRAIHRRLVYVATLLLQRDRGSLRSLSSTKKVGSNSKTASWFGNKIDEDFSVVHHSSGACRAARMSSIGTYPAAFLLRQITDLDVQCCRESKRWDFGTVVLMLIAIPALIGLFNDLVVEGTMETVLPSIVAGFVMFNNVLYRVSPVLIGLPYLIVFAVLFYFFGIVRPAVMQLQESRRKRMRKLSELSSMVGRKYTQYFGADGTSKKRKASELRRVLSRIRHKLSSAIIRLSLFCFPRFIQFRLAAVADKHSAGQNKAGGNKGTQSASAKTAAVRTQLWQRMNIPHRMQGYASIRPKRLHHGHKNGHAADDDSSVATADNSSLSSLYSSNWPRMSQQYRPNDIQNGHQAALLALTGDQSFRVDLHHDRSRPNSTSSVPEITDRSNARQQSEPVSVLNSVPDMIKAMVARANEVSSAGARSAMSIQVDGPISQFINSSVFEAAQSPDKINGDENDDVRSAPMLHKYGPHPRKEQYKLNKMLQVADYITSVTDGLQHLFASACLSTFTEGSTSYDSIRPSYPSISELLQLVDTDAITESTDVIIYRSHRKQGVHNGAETVEVPIRFSYQLMQELMASLWDVFLPGGLVLSEMEKQVVATDFSLWAQAQAPSTGNRWSHGASASSMEAVRISIFAFADWFLSYMDDVIRTKTVLRNYQCLFVNSYEDVSSSPIAKYGTSGKNNVATPGTSSCRIGKTGSLDFQS